MSTEFKMAMGLPRGGKINVKVGDRKASILLNLDKMVLAVTFDKSELPVLEYPTLENAVMSAETILKEDRN